MVLNGSVRRLMIRVNPDRRPHQNTGAAQQSRPALQNLSIDESRRIRSVPPKTQVLLRCSLAAGAILPWRDQISRARLEQHD